ncbi:hypothetical protein EUX98_g1998 [Antrodiella citrinella]|uniref:DUF6534 domain-containing protein n=1 Tax=Antrodiella citrinella TaxID=2447956 RepID=A0A4V3XJ90_9APHY|nr:hypothetical protein EUX98_g1998 [Antrodiella citrinella]
MATPADVIPGLILVTGPVLFAHLFNWGLFGVLSVQVYLYYIAFPSDHRGLKCVVAAIFLLEVTQTVLLTHDAFRVYASGWGNAIELNSIGLYWLNIPVLSGFISALTQLFYAWRIRILSRSYYAAGAICTVAIVQGVIEIYDGVICLQAGSLSKLPQSEASKVFVVWLAMSCACDVMITGSMFFYLQRAKKAILVKKTSNLLTRLIALTVETGLLSCTVQLTALICFVVADQTLLYTAPVSVTSKLYSNSLLTVRVFHVVAFGFILTDAGLYDRY